MSRACATWLALGGVASAAEQSADSKPVLVPGLYETESRNSVSRAKSTRHVRCIAAADIEAFRQETITNYLKAPQFGRVCTLSDSKALGDGFAFAMDCGIARSIVAYHVSAGLVRSTMETRNVARPENSSAILTLSRRVGDCPHSAPPGGRP